jgi:Zn-dependent protease with chaperone function
LADLGTPNAFTVGLLAPKVVVDRAWWRSLGATERRIVTAHETAHARCKDPLRHSIALWLAGLCPCRLGRDLVGGWLAWAERRADGYAARTVGDAAAVAALLVQQKRAEGPHPSLVPSFGGGGIEARVVAVLSGEDPVPRLGSRLGLNFAGALVLWTAVVATTGYSIHIAVEHLLRQLT